MVENLSLPQAWHFWFGGHSLADATVWGISVLWLGRGGKFIEFLGAATVVTDIIGPKRLRDFGTGLKSLAERERTWVNSKRAAKWLLDYYAPGPPTHENRREIEFTWEEFKANPLLFLSTFVNLLACFLTWRILPLKAIWIKIPLIIVALFVFTFTVGPLGAFVVASVFSFLVGVLDTFIVEPVAWLLERDALNVWIKIFGLTCLLGGFHFDLLAS